MKGLTNLYYIQWRINDYGLCFDKSLEDRFNGIINAIVQSGVNRYILDMKIPPPVTVSFSARIMLFPLLTS